jgi:hypothetical protein
MKAIKYFKIISFSFFLFHNVLAQDDPQTYNFDYFGVAFDVTTEGEVKLNESSHYLRDIRIGYFYNYKKIGLVSTADLQYIIPDKPKEPKDFKRFKKSINPALSEYKCKTYYHTYRDRNRYTQGILVYELNDNLNLVFEIKCYENYYDTKVDEMHEIIKAVKFTNGNQNGEWAMDSIVGLAIKKHIIKEGFLLAKIDRLKPILKEGYNNELLMLWEDVSDNFHITRFNKNGELIKDMDFEEKRIYDFVVEEDGVVFLTSKETKSPVLPGRTPRHSYIYIEKYNWEMQEVFSTYLMGQERIVKPGDQTFMQYSSQCTQIAKSDKYYAAHFTTYRKWPDMVTHQADAYYIVTKEGKLLSEVDENMRAYDDSWSVSHSFGQRIIFDGSKFMRFALGDAYPRAISVKRTYPEPIDAEYTTSYGQFCDFPGRSGDNYVYATYFGFPVIHNSQILFPYDHELKNGGSRSDNFSGKCANDLNLTIVDTNCKEVKTYQMTKTKNIEEEFVTVAVLNDTLLLCKWMSKYPPKRKTKDNKYFSSRVNELGIFNLKTGKMITRDKVVLHYNGGKASDFSAREIEGATYYPFNDYYSQQDFFSTPLLKDSEGKIWTVHFLLDQAGLQLIEIENKYE